MLYLEISETWTERGEQVIYDHCFTLSSDSDALPTPIFKTGHARVALEGAREIMQTLNDYLTLVPGQGSDLVIRTHTGKPEIFASYNLPDRIIQAMTKNFRTIDGALFDRVKKKERRG